MKKKPPKAEPEPDKKAERKAAKQVAATREKLKSAMDDPDFRARVVQQIKAMLREN